MLNSNSSKVVVQAFNKGYRALDNGDIVSPNNVILKGRTCRKGGGLPYKSFSVRIDGISYSIPVHRFVAFQKFGQLAFSCDCVRHLNGNSLDNSYSNIDIGTFRENSLDIPKEKRIEYARNAARHIMVYDEKTVSDIKAFHETTKSYRKTMEKFGITSKATLYNIIHNR